MLRKVNHGEVVVKEITELPIGLNKVVAKDFIVVGESETLGNDHRVAVLNDTDFYEKDGKLFMSVKTETTIFCPNDTKHSTKPIPEGLWEIDIAQEYDYIEQETRQVRD